MKRMSFVLNILAILLFTMSCGDSKSGDAKAPEGAAAGGTTTTSACEEFLNEYERFGTDFYAFMIQYRNNPMKYDDASLLSEYNDMVQKAGSLALRAKECAGDASAAKRILKVQTTIQESMSQ
jgi:hypothetical protein